MEYPKKIFLREVCPRDGWQKYDYIIPTKDKIALICSMIDTGVEELEIGRVSSNASIQQQYFDIKEVIKAIVPYAKQHHTKLNLLTTDYEAAAEAMDWGINQVDFFVSVSDAFAKSFGMTEAGAFKDIEKAVKIPGLVVNVSIGAVFGCPFGDKTPVEKTIAYAERAFALGAKTVGLGDSAGKSDPLHTGEILCAIRDRFDPKDFSLHIHHTEGFGFANSAKAMELGFTRFDTSLGGMGGCPMIPHAKGNLPTEDFVNLLNKMGIESGIDIDKCVEASLHMSEVIHNPVISSKASNTLLQRQQAE